MEIGSEFWINNIPTKSTFEVPKWLSKFGEVVLTTSGRGAITLLLRQIKPSFKTVLLPAYLCDSVIKTFIKEGYECLFYDINSDFTSNIENFSHFENIGIFFHMGYFGFNTNSNLELIIKRLKKKSTIIVEDVTHTLFSSYGRFFQNDFYVGSIRKWFGIPSGGFLASKSTMQGPQKQEEVFSQIRKQGLLLKGNYIKTNKENLKETFFKQFTIAERILDNDMNPYRIDDLSLQLLSACDEDELIRKRKQNCMYLLQGLKEIPFIKIVFSVLEKDTVPLFFPILIKGDREHIKQNLIAERIYCPIHWPISDKINTDTCKKSYELQKLELSIPCDQRYGIVEMARIVSVFKSIQKQKQNEI